MNHVLLTVGHTDPRENARGSSGGLLHNPLVEAGPTAQQYTLQQNEILFRGHEQPERGVPLPGAHLPGYPGRSDRNAGRPGGEHLHLGCLAERRARDHLWGQPAGHALRTAGTIDHPEHSGAARAAAQSAGQAHSDSQAHTDGSAHTQGVGRFERLVSSGRKFSLPFDRHDRFPGTGSYHRAGGDQWDCYDPEFRPHQLPGELAPATRTASTGAAGRNRAGRGRHWRQCRLGIGGYDLQHGFPIVHDRPFGHSQPCRHRQARRIPSARVWLSRM